MMRNPGRFQAHLSMLNEGTKQAAHYRVHKTNLRNTTWWSTSYMRHECAESYFSFILF